MSAWWNSLSRHAQVEIVHTGMVVGIASGVVALLRAKGRFGGARRASGAAAMATAGGDHEFATVADRYKKFRPYYPDSLLDGIVAAFEAQFGKAQDGPASTRPLVLDLGCGTGQVTVPLARAGFQVVGIDKTQNMLDEAERPAELKELLSYRIGRHSETGAESGSVSMITAAQSAHWFDMPGFFAEAKRVLKPKGVVAICGYGLCRIEAPGGLDAVFRDYYKSLETYWPPKCDRSLLDNAFATIDFPFADVQRVRIDEKHRMALGQFLEYVSTWSAVVEYKKRHPDREDPVLGLKRDLMAVAKLKTEDDYIDAVFPFFLVTMHMP